MAVRAVERGSGAVDCAATVSGGQRFRRSPGRSSRSSMSEPWNSATRASVVELAEQASPSRSRSRGARRPSQDQSGPRRSSDARLQGAAGRHDTRLRGHPLGSRPTRAINSFGGNGGSTAPDAAIVVSSRPCRLVSQRELRVLGHHLRAHGLRSRGPQARIRCSELPWMGSRSGLFGTNFGTRFSANASERRSASSCRWR